MSYRKITNKSCLSNGIGRRFCLRSKLLGVRVPPKIKQNNTSEDKIYLWFSIRHALFIKKNNKNLKMWSLKFVFYTL